MSRSYKRNINRIHGPLAGGHNRTLRRVNRQRIAEGKEPLSRRELINDWDLTDWIFIGKGKISK